MNLAEIQKRMSVLNDWALETNSINKEFNFPNFKKAIEFVNKVSDVADKNNHHPDIMISYNIVKLVLTTHYEKGLSEKDFIVAEEIDKIV